jgi:hypothetical protein
MSEVLTRTDPYVNSNLFSSFYLRERLDDLDAWDCDPEVKEVFEGLQELYRVKGEYLPGLKEDCFSTQEPIRYLKHLDFRGSRR